jgi:predicted small metal-binding protein
VAVAHEPRKRDPALRSGELGSQLRSIGSYDEAPTQLHDHISDNIHMAKRIVCECGYIVRGEDDEQLVELGREHMQANHPAIAAVITTTQLLELAEEE